MSGLPAWARALWAEASLASDAVPRVMGGGAHGELWRVGDWVVKGCVRPSDQFVCEADGLRALAMAGVRVPEVATADAHGLVMRYLPPGPADPAALGRMIARLHAASAPTYGWRTGPYLGSFRFPHGTGSWQEVFRHRRIQPLLRATWSTLGRLGPELERWLRARPLPEEGPVLVHGDLWSGNALATSEGPALVDPGAQWAERGWDLAMMELFGGFGGRCRGAYEEVLPVPRAVREALPAYRLVFLLVHVHFYGTSYLGQVAEVLRS